MDIEEIREFCLSQAHVSELFPFDEDTLVFKVLDKIYALIPLDHWEMGKQQISLKCDPNDALELREKYPETLVPAYHMNKKHWNTINVYTGEFSEKKIKHFILHSYALVVSKMPKSKSELLK